MIKGILVRPQCLPVTIEFPEGYRELQKLVDGPFEMPYLFDDVDIVINEEGKLNGSPANRFLYLDGQLTDIIFGNIVIVDSDSEGRTVSLSEEKISRYMSIFSSMIIRLQSTQKASRQTPSCMNN